MSDAIDTAQNNPEIRCLIVTGGSGVFSAGNDVEDFLNDATSDAETPRASNATKFLYSLAHNVKPLIAAVDGVAIGIGTTLLFHCDYVLASTTATFSTPFIQLGLVPEGASTLLMPRTMGDQRAFATLVMGRKITAEEARVAGFVNVVVAPGHTEAEARKVAREICALPAEAVALSRKLLRLPPEDWRAGSTRKATCSANACAPRKPSPRSSGFLQGRNIEQRSRPGVRGERSIFAPREGDEAPTPMRLRSATAPNNDGDREYGSRRASAAGRLGEIYVLHDVRQSPSPMRQSCRARGEVSPPAPLPSSPPRRCCSPRPRSPRCRRRSMSASSRSTTSTATSSRRPAAS